MEKELKTINEDDLAKVTGGSTSYDLTSGAMLMLLVTRYYKDGYTLEQTLDEIKKQIKGTDYNYYETIGIVYELWGTLEKEYPDRNISFL